jgi:hypothetical protein
MVGTSHILDFQDKPVPRRAVQAVEVSSRTCQGKNGYAIAWTLSKSMSTSLHARSKACTGACGKKDEGTCCVSWGGGSFNFLTLNPHGILV